MSYTAHTYVMLNGLLAPSLSAHRRLQLNDSSAQHLFPSGKLSQNPG